MWDILTVAHMETDVILRRFGVVGRGNTQGITRGTFLFTPKDFQGSSILKKSLESAEMVGFHGFHAFRLRLES